jgi:hypothetical protein
MIEWFISKFVINKQVILIEKLDEPSATPLEFYQKIGETLNNFAPYLKEPNVFLIFGQKRVGRRIAQIKNSGESNVLEIRYYDWPENSGFRAGIEVSRDSSIGYRIDPRGNFSYTARVTHEGLAKRLAEIPVHKFKQQVAKTNSV